MPSLRTLVRDITGKTLHVVDVADWYRHYVDKIEVPGGRGFKEGVIHEVLHWVVADDWQRVHPENLGYGHTFDGSDGRDPRCTEALIDLQELETCHLQQVVYQFGGVPFPKGSPSCRGDRLRSPLSPPRVAAMLERADGVGWDRLIALVHARR